MENFVSKARQYVSTKDGEAFVIMHEEMMDELREHTKLLKHLIKLEKLDIQTPKIATPSEFVAEAHKDTLKELKVNNQKLTNAGKADLKTEVRASFDKKEG